MLSETLCKLRKKHGLSQQEVADILEVTRQTVSNWECAQGAPTLDKAKLLAQLYHVSLDDLVGNEIEFVTKKTKETSPILFHMINKICKIYYDDNYQTDIVYRVLDVNEDWVKVEYERRKEDAILKKETIIKYIDVSTVNGFCILKEEN